MKKRVLHILASNSYSGAENVVCTIIDNCSDKYDMYYCSPDGPIREVLKKRNIKFIPLKKLSILNLKKIIKDYNIDIIHAHDYKASTISVFLNTKTISHIHCDYNLLWCKKIVALIYSIVQKKFERIVVVSKEILENATFKNKITDKAVVLNNVFDSKGIIDKSIEFDTKKYDLIFVGRLISLKQPLLFIDIVSKLKENKSNIKACIIGDGELYQECKNKINTLNLENNIELLGFKNNPFPYVRNSKIAILPSLYEGFGLVAIESMILGTIVLNSGVGGLNDIFKYYPKYICKDIDEYVDKAKELLNVDKNTYKDDCNKMIKNYTDIGEYKKKVLRLYKEVLK